MVDWWQSYVDILGERDRRYGQLPLKRAAAAAAAAHGDVSRRGGFVLKETFNRGLLTGGGGNFVRGIFFGEDFVRCR